MVLGRDTQPCRKDTISLGAEYVFNPADIGSLALVALSETQFLVAYGDSGNSYFGTASVGTVSGTTIAFGPEYVFNSAGSGIGCAASLSETKAVIIYGDTPLSNRGTGIIADISGTLVTFGTETVFDTSSLSSVAALSADKFVVIYADMGSSGRGTAVVGTVSGSSISFGAGNSVSTTQLGDPSVAALSATRFVALFFQSGVLIGEAIIGEVSGSSISFGGHWEFDPRRAGYISVTALTPRKFAFAYWDGEDGDAGNANVGYEMSGNLIGTANVAAGSGESVEVVLSGVSDSHSGLMAGQMYFSDINGNLTTNEGKLQVGMAISDTELLLNSTAQYPYPIVLTKRANNSGKNNPGDNSSIMKVDRDYEASERDAVIVCDAEVRSIIVTLPSAKENTGYEMTIKKKEAHPEKG